MEEKEQERLTERYFHIHPHKFYASTTLPRKRNRSFLDKPLFVTEQQLNPFDL
jgi:hypothetical protein